MPAVAQTGNSCMTALVTGDKKKAEQLSRRYGIEHTLDYDGIDDLLASGRVDALYVATPNDQHLETTVKALRAGVHVLLEKPMAVSEAECRQMIDAAQAGSAKLMIAYRLHFEPATLAAIEKVREGALGEVRLFSSVFGQLVSPDNHRAKQGYWAGPVADMGPYPINAARNLFRAEPLEVIAHGMRHPELEMDFHDTVSVSLRFPGDRLAQLTVSYATAEVGQYRICGSRGDLEVSPGYAFGDGVALEHRLTLDGKTTHTRFEATDQFGGELRYFSDCVLHDREPEPNGYEGLADVRVLAAIERALQTGAPVRLEPFEGPRYADPRNVQTLPPIETPELVDASTPGGD